MAKTTQKEVNARVAQDIDSHMNKNKEILMIMNVHCTMMSLKRSNRSTTVLCMRRTALVASRKMTGSREAKRVRGRHVVSHHRLCGQGQLRLVGCDDCDLLHMIDGDLQ